MLKIGKTTKKGLSIPTLYLLNKQHVKFDSPDKVITMESTQRIIKGINT